MRRSNGYEVETVSSTELAHGLVMCCQQSLHFVIQLRFGRGKGNVAGMQYMQYIARQC
jgi:hypothetical protein